MQNKNNKNILQAKGTSVYWDGLVLKGEQPKEGILLAEDFGTNIEMMANEMNTLPPPLNSKPYNFKIEKLSDKGL